MSISLKFQKQFAYNTFDIGITVPIYLSSGTKKASLDAKIDTGASYCIFNRRYAEDLDLEVEAGEPLRFGTVTGSFLAYGHELLLTVLGLEFYTTVYFAENEYFSRNVLGRQGWLDRIKLGLIDQEGKLFLSDLTDEE